LHPASECLKALADLGCARRIQLVYGDVLELPHEAQPVVQVPAERERSYLLLAAIDPASDILRDARNDIAVEIDNAVAGRDFPSAYAAIPDADRAIDFGLPQVALSIFAHAPSPPLKRSIPAVYQAMRASARERETFHHKSTIILARR
jgi:hypothetical protein